MHPWDAVVTAAIHRTRPILLTASAASLGMIPIARRPSSGAPWRSPSSVGWRWRAVRTLMIFLPALYVAWFRIAEPAAAPREVEQAEFPAHA